MSADNFLLLREHEGRYVVTHEFMSSENFSTINTSGGMWFDTYDEAGAYIDKEYDNYDGWYYEYSPVYLCEPPKEDDMPSNTDPTYEIAVLVRTARKIKAIKLLREMVSNYYATDFPSLLASKETVEWVLTQESLPSDAVLITRCHDRDNVVRAKRERAEQKGPELYHAVAEWEEMTGKINVRDRVGNFNFTGTDYSEYDLLTLANRVLRIFNDKGDK